MFKTPRHREHQFVCHGITGVLPHLPLLLFVLVQPVFVVYPTEEEGLGRGFRKKGAKVSQRRIA